MELLQSDLADIEDISGQHQVSKGSAPAGVTAGTAIQFLQEADNSFMATTHASIEDAIKKVAKQSIALAIQYWDSKRLVKVIGKDGSLSARYLEGADLINGTDIRIEGGSSLPQSKAARIALFMDLMNRGFLPPQDGLKLMKLSNMQEYWDEVDIDKNQALRENLQMSELDPQQTAKARQEVTQSITQQVSAGMPPGIDPMSNPIAAQEMELANEPVIPVNEWDNHEIHLMVIENFMKGQEYETLDPAIQNEFKLHRQKHKDAMMQKMMEDMMKQQANPDAGQSGQSGGGNQFNDIQEPPPLDSAPQPA
jgi:hypothetical protein